MIFIFSVIITALGVAVTYDWVRERSHMTEERQSFIHAATLLNAHNRFLNEHEAHSAATLTDDSADADKDAGNRKFSFKRFYVDEPSTPNTLYISIGFYHANIDDAKRHAIADELHKLANGSKKAGALTFDGTDYAIHTRCFGQAPEDPCAAETLPAILKTELQRYNPTFTQADLLKDGNPVIYFRRTP